MEISISIAPFFGKYNTINSVVKFNDLYIEKYYNSIELILLFFYILKINDKL